MPSTKTLDLNCISLLSRAGFSEMNSCRAWHRMWPKVIVCWIIVGWVNEQMSEYRFIIKLTMKYKVEPSWNLLYLVKVTFSITMQSLILRALHKWFYTILTAWFPWFKIMISMIFSRGKSRAIPWYNGYSTGYWNQPTQVAVIAFPLAGSVTLSTLLSFSDGVYSPVKNKHNHFKRLVWGLHELTCVKYIG